MSEFSEYMRLLPYGYAPGNYMSKCFACEKVVADVDKRATSCRPCAEAAFKDHEIERLRAEAAGLQIKADLFDLAVRKGLLSVHSELIDPRNHGTRCSWLEGHAKACDISNNAALAARTGEAMP